MSDIAMAGVAGLVDTAADLTMDIVNAVQTSKQNKLNREAFDFNKQLATEQWEWAKQQADIQKSREDSAYQRKVADMMKAGLNPVLAAGGAGASASAGSAAGSQVTAPTVSKYEKMSNMLAISRAVQEAKSLDAQMELTKEETKNKIKDNEIKDTIAAKELVNLENAKKDGAYKDAEIVSKDLDNKAKQYELDKTEKTGISKGGDTGSNIVREATNATINLVENAQNWFEEQKQKREARKAARQERRKKK